MQNHFFPSEVRFTLKLGGTDDETKLNSFDEGVELAFQHINGSGEWIPLMFYVTDVDRAQDDHGIFIGNITSRIVSIRGYNVPYVISTNNQRCEHKVKVCIDVDNNEWIKLRWLQTVYQGRSANRDRVFLDNVQISSFLTQQQGVILCDDFDNQTAIK